MRKWVKIRLLPLSTDRRSSAGGFTMVELLVVLLIGSILTLGVVSLFTNQTRAMALNEDLVDLQQNLRVAMDMLHRDVRMAGANVKEVFPSFVIGGIDYNEDGIDDFDSDGGGANSDAIMIQSSPDSGKIIKSYNGSAANLQVCRPSDMAVGQFIPVSTTGSPIESRGIVVTNVGPVSCPSQGCPGDNCDKINFSPSGSSYNTPGGLGADYEDGRMWNNMQTITYFVSQDANGDGVSEDPALMRVFNRSVPTVVAFGVNDLQIIYKDGAGTPTTSLADIRLVAIELTGETRNTHSFGGAPGKRTRTMTTEVLVRNLAF